MVGFKRWWLLLVLLLTLTDASFESTSKSSPPTPFDGEIPDHHEEKQDVTGGIEDDFYQESIVYTTLAGNVSPFFRRFMISKQELLLLWASLRSKAHPEDMLLMLFVGWTTVPTIRLFYNLFWRRLYVHALIATTKMIARKAHASSKAEVSDGQTKSSSGVTATLASHPSPKTSYSKGMERAHGSFQSSTLFLISDHIQQIAKIALAVYLVDVSKLFMVGLGFKSCTMSNFPHVFAQLAYTVWVGQRLAVGKKTLLREYVSQHPETFGRIQITNRLLNAAIIASTGFIVLSILKLQMGVAVNSFLALGSLSTLALTLASQGIVTNVLNGLMLASSDRIYEGDVVRFGNGLKGTIVDLGWMETVIRGSDEVMISVQHSDLVKQQVSNLSRVRYSQVYQLLKFKYKDADKLPDLITSIKNEIYAACPSLITDGERPFRVYWSDYGSDALEVTVDAHFRLRILSEEYHENRQRVLLAIQKAVKSNGLTFAKE